MLTADGRPTSAIGERTAAGDTFEVELLADDVDPLALLDAVGEMPLPPYITTPLGDPARYQTVFAADPGQRRRADGRAPLHRRVVRPSRRGRGRRRPRSNSSSGSTRSSRSARRDPLDHPMHTERYRVPESTLQACQDAAPCRRRRHDGGAGTGVGCCPRRAASGRTDLFIHRGFDWQVVDVLMTNFHLPKTTLLMMIDAFVGDRWRRLYDEALAGDYRFLSFGDAMLLDRTRPLASARCIRVDLTIDGADGAARAGTATTARGHLHDAAVHAGRHAGARSST